MAIVRRPARDFGRVLTGLPLQAGSDIAWAMVRRPTPETAPSS
jgi:hypothetical protein